MLGMWGCGDLNTTKTANKLWFFLQISKNMQYNISNWAPPFFVLKISILQKKWARTKCNTIRRFCHKNEKLFRFISVNCQAFISVGLMVQISSKRDHYVVGCLLRRKCKSGINHFEPSHSLNIEISCFGVTSLKNVALILPNIEAADLIFPVN